MPHLSILCLEDISASVDRFTPSNGTWNSTTKRNRGCISESDTECGSASVPGFLPACRTNLYSGHRPSNTTRYARSHQRLSSCFRRRSCSGIILLSGSSISATIITSSSSLLFRFRVTLITSVVQLLYRSHSPTI